MTAYSVENLLQALRNPEMFLGLVNEWGEQTNQWYHRRFTPNDGLFVMNRDWDNLIILDACRYDLFESHNSIDGEYRRVKSRGGTSEEFFSENFSNNKFGDTVYTSANPWVQSYTDSFHDVIHLYAGDDWDDSVQTVPPEATASAALDAQEEYPHKRHIIHFMQPHLPPLGDVREEFPVLFGPTGPYGGRHRYQADGSSDLGFLASLRFRQNGITPSLVQRAQKENLRIVLDVIADLLDELVGKSVITADHGDLYGERLRPIPTRGYLHRWHLRHEKLITVPWLERDADERPEILDDGVNHSVVDSKVVHDRLDSLGYM